LLSDIADKEIEVGYLQKFIFTNPEKGILDTIKSISIDETQHPPLYYVLSSLWLKIFGNSIWVIRSFSVLMRILALPCVFWLSRELFESKKVAWLATAILAVSPFHLIYAQEARLYSMWTLTTLLASAILLRALSRKSKLWWALYGVSLLIGIYTFTLFALVIAAHGLYALLIYLPKINFRPIDMPKNLISYVITTAVAVILFLPWAYLLAKNLSRAQSNLDWMKYDIGIPALIKLWGFNISSAFLDIGLVPKINLPFEMPLTSIEFMSSPHLDGILGNFPILSTIYFIVKALIVILIFYSIYYLARKTEKRCSLFILSLIVIPFVGVAFQDLIFGGVGSTIVGYRFFVPVIIGIELAVAYLLASKTTRTSGSGQKAWQAFLVVILLFGLFSCFTYFKADTWWTLRYGYHIKRIAPIINNSEEPLVITKFDSQILAFPHHLNDEVKLITIENMNKLDTSLLKGDIFLYGLKPDEIEKFNKFKGFRVVEVNPDDRLWKLVKIN